MRQVELSERAKQKAYVMFGLTDAEIVERFRLSARITHPDGTRRYERILFQVTPVMHGAITIEDILRL